MRPKTRAQEERVANERPKNWRPPSADPFEGLSLGPEWVLKLIRKFINGAEEDKTSFFGRRQRGWEPVKAEELPAQYQYLKDDQGLISYNGCILCKNTKAMAQADKKHWEDQALGTVAGLQQSYLEDQHESVPKFSEGRTNVFRGRVVDTD